VSDEQPIGETIEQKIRELGEEIREMRLEFRMNSSDLFCG